MLFTHKRHFAELIKSNSLLTFNLGIQCHNSSSSSSSHKECTQGQVQLLCACPYCTVKIKIIFTDKNRVEHYLHMEPNPAWNWLMVP
jgi:hypothetical protein